METNDQHDAAIHAALYARWQKQVQPLCADTALTDSLFNTIQTHYQEPHRAYHNLYHLDHLFKDLDNTHCTDAMAFAVWYHDIIYKPGSTKNETLSADIAEQALTRLGLPAPLIQHCKHMIEATYSHTQAGHDIDTQLFLDADMAILGSPLTTYKRYVEKIASEFNNVPSFLFKRGRKRFIKKTLAQEAIYQTAYFSSKYEQQARINLHAELTDTL